MPAYKVPCPRCGQFIMRDVAVCPFCQSKDPFAPIRCVSCNAIIEDARWTACPRCGTAVPGRPQPRTPPAQPAPATGAPVNPWLTAQPAPALASAPATQPAPALAPSQPAGQPAAAPVGPVSQAFCTGCGAALTAGARFCNVCGTLAS